jgi:hypothetical protein
MSLRTRLRRGPLTGARLRAAEAEIPFRDRSVIPYARLRGWRWYFTARSEHSPAGFPDLVLCRPPRLLLVELKAAGKHPTAEQRCWLALLAECAGVEVFVWTPADWAQIEEVLA